MRRITIVGLLLASAVALGAIAASSALAAGGPEYLACAKAKKDGKKYTGRYENKTCSELSGTGEGKYERVAAKFPLKFKSKIGETKVHVYDPKDSAEDAEVICTKGKDAGAITSSTAGTVTITEEGCNVPVEDENGNKSKFPGACNTPGQKSGVIVSKPLATKLVWLDEAHTEPGIEIQPAEAGGVFEEASCLFEKVKVKETGTILAAVSPVGVATKLLTITFSVTPMTYEQVPGGYWEGETFTATKLVSEIHATGGIEEVGAPTSEASVVPQKSGPILVS